MESESRPLRVRPPKPCIGCAQNGRMVKVDDGGSWCPECKPSKGKAYRHPDYLALKAKIRNALRIGKPILCAWCHKAPAVEVDHVTALAHGGKPDASNLCPSCRRCNRGKNSGGHDG